MNVVNRKNLLLDTPFTFTAINPLLRHLDRRYRSLGELETALEGIGSIDDPQVEGLVVDFTTLYVIGTRQYPSLALQTRQDMYHLQAKLKLEY